MKKNSRIKLLNAILLSLSGFIYVFIIGEGLENFSFYLIYNIPIVLIIVLVNCFTRKLFDTFFFGFLFAYSGHFMITIIYGVLTSQSEWVLTGFLIFGVVVMFPFILSQMIAVRIVFTTLR